MEWSKRKVEARIVASRRGPPRSMTVSDVKKPNQSTKGVKMSDEESNIILYTTDDGKAQVSLMSRDGRVWLNPKQMAELFALAHGRIPAGVLGLASFGIDLAMANGEK